MPYHRFILFAMMSMLAGVALAQSEIETVRANIAKMLPPNMAVSEVSQTPMESVYEVSVGKETLYVYAKKEFVMVGEVYDTEQGVSWSQQRKDKQAIAALAELEALPESEMIIMGDPDGQRFITVFTDTDCGWCQKFHQDIAVLAEGGLKVRYILWPGAGLNSASYDEAVSVWCADDRGKAITTAKNREQVAPKVCDNPIKEHYALGFRLGVQGTPFVMLDTGEVLGGYLPPERLLSVAGLQ